MTFYELLLPQATLLFGILAILSMHIFSEDPDLNTIWIIQVIVLVLATFQQCLLYRVYPTIYVRGGLVLDGISQVLSLSILLLSLLVHLNRTLSKQVLRTQADALALGMTLFALFSVQTNRFLFGVLSLVGLVWFTQGALASEESPSRQTVVIHSGMIRGIILLVIGIFLCVFCYGAFGETQIDEIQRLLIRPRVNDVIVFSVQTVILFLGALVMGIPPFQGLLGQSRKGKTSWSLSIGGTGLFAIVGLGIFLRWGVLVFSRSAVGHEDLEALFGADIFIMMRAIAMGGLILIPLLALFHQHLRGSLLLFALNPFVQCLFCISFGHREVLGFATGYILLSSLNLGLLISALKALAISEDFSLENWTGIGRRGLIPTVILLLSLASFAGLSPFYGSLMIQKTLSIKALSGFVLLVNLAMGGYFVARLAELAFQKPHATEIFPFGLSKLQKIWFLSQFVALIFMGIFWQPLYKYGAYSIRGFFGDI